MNVVACRVFVNRFRAGPDRQVRRGQVSRAAEEFRQQRAKGFDGVLGCFTAGDFRRVSLQLSDEFVGFRVEVSRHFAFHTTGKLSSLLREGFRVGSEFLIPGRFFGCACFFRIPLRIDLRRDFKGSVFPAQSFPGQRHFCVAQRRAVGVVRTGFVRRTEADNGFAHQQGRLVGHGTGFFHGALDCVRVMAVNAAYHVPAVGFKAFGGIVGKPAFHVTVDGDTVVVIERYQLAELQGTGQGAHLVGDAFHHAAIAHKRVGEVVDNVVTRAVELRRQRFFGDSHAHGVSDALAQRTGGGFHASGVAHFRVARGFRVQLTEVFQLVNRQVIAGEVQQAVNQH